MEILYFCKEPNLLSFSHNGYFPLVFATSPRRFFKIIYLLKSGICYFFWKPWKDLTCSYSKNWWTAVSLKPFCRYQQIIDAYQRIFVWRYLTSCLVFFLFLCFSTSFFLIHLHFFMYVAIRYLLNNKQSHHFTNFVINLVNYLNINLRKSKNLAF